MNTIIIKKVKKSSQKLSREFLAFLSPWQLVSFFLYRILKYYCPDFKEDSVYSVDACDDLHSQNLILVYES